MGTLIYLKRFKQRKQEKQDIAEENQWAFEHGINLFSKEPTRIKLVRGQKDPKK